MNSGITITVLIIATICSMPFVMMVMNRKKREKIMINSVTKIADKNDCRLNDYDVFTNFMIGIDDFNNTLFYANKNQENIDVNYINLSEIKNCKVKTITNNDKKIKGKSSFTMINELNLLLTPFDKPDLKVTFYNSDSNMQLSNELMVAKKWSDHINKQLHV
ncbi:hypothetical protein KO500_08165 [Cellulophaga baltica]|uniref:hypothetical protein n=1 Tax=Cellulophaga TaxID=104264 RepID=UPI001C0672A5|nr:MULTISPECIES: hypothetical protein [Cellulophaga]MBU2996406.1 hypothetical protein [Cellulophaga baltica]MDO6767802.1 hypothetical protein [Cellulophaga sp. 1_MG-2023]